jgi:hypothetical protein
MQKMLVCGVLAALTACGGGQKQAEPAKPQAPIENKAPAEPVVPKTDTDLAMDAMKSFRDQFCACTNSDCAQRVANDMSKWGQEMAKKYNDKDTAPKMSEQQTKEMQQIGMEMGNCMTKAMGASPPPSTGSNPCGGGP